MAAVGINVTLNAITTNASPFTYTQNTYAMLDSGWVGILDLYAKAAQTTLA